MAGDAGSGLSKGGMKTKLMAAKTATAAGCAMVITEGSRLNPLSAIDQGVPSTWFTAVYDPQRARKGWISSMKPMGRIVVDAGAETALSKGKSLLPAGVTGVEGEFARGDAVVICSASGQELAHGISAYPSDEARALMGRNTKDIEEILGYPGRAALVHRDDMAT
jgi:glutamate 5-kinase